MPGDYLPEVMMLHRFWIWLVANLETILKFTQLIGIPVAIILYVLNKRKERRDKDYGTYDRLDDKYTDYLKLCLDYPDLDVADAPRPVGPLNQDQQHRELIMFSILVSIMERAYLMYKDRSYKVREQQWAGWEAYIEQWGKRQNFRTALPRLAFGFDERFVSYLHTKIIFEEDVEES